MGSAANSERVGLAVAPDGEQIALAWATHPAEGRERIHLLTLHGDGSMATDQDLEPAVDDVKQVQLLMRPDGTLDVLWSAGKWQERALWFSPLTPVAAGSAAPALEPQQISPAGVALHWFKAGRLPSGRLLVLWQDGDGRLGGWLEGGEEPFWLLDGVLQVDFRLDETGLVQLAWSVQKSVTRIVLVRAEYDLASKTLSDPELIHTVVTAGSSASDVVDGPVLGQQDGGLVLAWTQKVVNLMGTTENLFVMRWPDGEAHQVGILPFFPPRTALQGEQVAYGPIAPEAASSRTASISRAPFVLDAPDNQTVLVTSALYMTRSRQEYQPTLVFLRDGQVLGYQALTWTDKPSIKPAAAADENRNLYVAWLDATGESHQYPVYLASTNPDLHAAWDRLTGRDYLVMAADLGSRVSTGVFLIPLTVIWVLLPFPLIILAMWLTHGDLYGRRGRWLLIASLVVYWIAKYLFTFQVLENLPGLSSISPAVGAVLVYLVPLLTLALVAVPVWLIYVRRAGDDFSVMRAYFTIAVIDWLVSMAVYAIGYFE